MMKNESTYGDRSPIFMNPLSPLAEPPYESTLKKASGRAWRTWAERSLIKVVNPCWMVRLPFAVPSKSTLTPSIFLVVSLRAAMVLAIAADLAFGSVTMAVIPLVS